MPTMGRRRLRPRTRCTLLAQHAPQHLPQHVVRQFATNFDLRWHLVLREPDRTERDQLLWVDGMTWLRHDVGHHHLALPAVRHADGGAFPYSRMGSQDFFHLRGVDVEAVHDDDVSFAVDEGEEAVRAHDGNVAGAKPAAEQHLSGLLRLVPVTREDLRAIDEQLAGLSDRDTNPG